MELRFAWADGGEHEAVWALARSMCGGARLWRAESGQPRMEGGYLSLSHSHGLVACAVSAEPVGLDVERIRPVSPRLLRLLSPEERDYVRCDADFFRLWTLKESLIKCRGGHLGQLRQIHFRLDGGSIRCSEPGYRFTLPPAPEGYVAALCGREGGREL